MAFAHVVPAKMNAQGDLSSRLRVDRKPAKLVSWGRESMRLADAKQEFNCRCYYWCVSEFEREIDQSFPNLGKFKTGAGWKLVRFMRNLPIHEQRSFARALCKQWYASDIKALGEPVSAQEAELLRLYDDAFRFRPTSLEAEIDARKSVGEKIKFVSKRKLRNAVVAKFIERYGPRCVRMETGDDWDPLFFMELCGWLLLTQFTFGRQQTVLSYRHSIVSNGYRIQLETGNRDSSLTGPAWQLAPGIAWIANQWECLLESDVEQAADAVAKQCGYFFDVALNLLRGLELEKIDPE